MSSTVIPLNSKIPSTDIPSSIDGIILYLNNIADKRLSLNTISTRQLIQRLFYKGFTVTDIKMVIDCKVKEWSSVPVMKRYIRPQTLFDHSNFTRYYNENIERKGQNAQ